MNRLRVLKTPCPTCGGRLTQRLEVELSMGEDGGLLPIETPVCDRGHLFLRSADEPLPD